MNSIPERSCWGVARWAVAAFLVGIALIYLFGGLPGGAGRRRMT
ncbi:hypothetical protein ACFSKM_13370 [Ancylobacter dichloromethanicus]